MKVAIITANTAIYKGNEEDASGKVIKHMLEKEEHEVVYPAFAQTAEEEGFSRVAAAFRQIAEVEKSHAARFRRFGDLLGQGKLFASEQSEHWVCLNCGFIYEGKEAPKICPVCEHAQGYFARASQVPFGNGVY